MNRIRFLTAGESHGQALVTIVEGLPAGLELSEDEIAIDLRRRQRGHGRGGRMKIEQDRVRFLAGVRYGKTLGSPVAMLLENRDWPNWTQKMAVAAITDAVQPLHMPRPGHADFAGMVKYRQDDLRNILERSSARETAMRVAAGAVARKLIKQFKVSIFGHVTSIGGVRGNFSALDFFTGENAYNAERLARWQVKMDDVEHSPVACADPVIGTEMIKNIDAAAAQGDSLGGSFEIVVLGAPVGLGSHVHWDRRLDTLLSAALMSIPAIKAIEFGLGQGVAERPGSQVHDELFYNDNSGYYRASNNAGGIEGGMSNGEAIIIRLYMKPLPTLSQPLQSLDVATHQPQKAFHERADVCAVPAAVVVAEAMTALTIANTLCEKLGGDSITEMQEHFKDIAHVPLGW